jgi:hypothetical protein
MGVQTMMKKPILWILAFLLGSSLLLSQDLVEAAKKEKERRAQLKKRSTVVVTNADLGKKPGEEIVKVESAEEPSRKIQGTAPQTRSLPTKTSPALKVTSQNQMEAQGYRGDFATRILSASEIVKNPDFALDKPDGRYAEIPVMGFIELEISAKNGPGEDIAIYALHVGTTGGSAGEAEQEGIPEVSAVYDFVEGFWFGILGMEERGDWVTIGKGTGMKSPEKFDLGELRSLKKVRIMFRPDSSGDLPFKLETWQAGEFVFRIDAVESLHR